MKRKTQVINFQKAYGRSYYEVFIAPQKPEKEKNFTEYLRLILERKPMIERVLDAGCGQGGFLDVCERRGIHKLYGIDVSSYAINSVKKRTKAKLLQMNLEGRKLPYKARFFDLVVAIDVIEHFRYTKAFFKEVARVLKDDGLFFVTTENSGALFDKLFSPFYPRHEVHINLQKEEYWNRVLFQSGFHRIENKGIVLHGFPPPLNLRNFLRKLKVPVLVRPIFSPLRTFSGTLVIFAQK